jgi:prevent-host-death family protein
MKGEMPMTLSTIDARKNFSEILNRAAYGKERVILTRRGKPLAAIVPIEDIETLEELEDRLDLKAAEKALVEGEKEGTVPWDQVKRELDLE